MTRALGVALAMLLALGVVVAYWAAYDAGYGQCRSFYVPWVAGLQERLTFTRGGRLVEPSRTNEPAIPEPRLCYDRWERVTVTTCDGGTQVLEAKP